MQKKIARQGDSGGVWRGAREVLRHRIEVIGGGMKVFCLTDEVFCRKRRFCGAETRFSGPHYLAAVGENLYPPSENLHRNAENLDCATPYLSAPGCRAASGKMRMKGGKIGQNRMKLDWEAGGTVLQSLKIFLSHLLGLPLQSTSCS